MHKGWSLTIVVVQVRAVKNICSSSGGAQDKGKTGWNSVYNQNWWFSEFHPRPPWMLMYFFAGFFSNLTCVWPNSGFWCCVCLTLRVTLLCGKSRFWSYWNLSKTIMGNLIVCMNTLPTHNFELTKSHHNMICFQQTKFTFLPSKNFSVLCKF